ncbi:MAG: hypothetical protein WCG42_08180 [Parachlamydiaceae bacterium]
MKLFKSLASVAVVCTAVAMLTSCCCDRDPCCQPARPVCCPKPVCCPQPQQQCCPQPRPCCPPPCAPQPCGPQY